jgi:hypothetical protein
MTEKKEPIGQAAQAKAAPREEKVALTADFGKVYCRIQGNEIMRPVRADMTLYEKLGHFYSIYSGKEKGNEGGEEKKVFKYALTSAAYIHLNKVASISIATPQFVIVDGVQQPNPYIERNKKTKSVEAVHIRKIGIGYSPIGAVVVIDKTLYYNTYTYFIQSIQAKMKKQKWEKGHPTGPAFPDAAELGTGGAKPSKKGNWIFFLVQDPVGIWANIEDQAIKECLDEHIQRLRFGDRIAQKIVERNILKDHPAIGVTNVFVKDGTDGKWASVVVYGYRHDKMAPNIAELMRKAETGDEAADFEIKAEKISEAVEPEVEREAIKESAADEGVGPEGEMPPLDEIK